MTVGKSVGNCFKLTTKKQALQLDSIKYTNIIQGMRFFTVITR